MWGWGLLLAVGFTISPSSAGPSSRLVLSSAEAPDGHHVVDDVNAWWDPFQNHSVRVAATTKNWASGGITIKPSADIWAEARSACAGAMSEQLQCAELIVRKAREWWATTAPPLGTMSLAPPLGMSLAVGFDVGDGTTMAIGSNAHGRLPAMALSEKKAICMQLELTGPAAAIFWRQHHGSFRLCIELDREATLVGDGGHRWVQRPGDAGTRNAFCVQPTHDYPCVELSGAQSDTVGTIRGSAWLMVVGADRSIGTGGVPVPGTRVPFETSLVDSGHMRVAADFMPWARRFSSITDFSSEEVGKVVIPPPLSLRRRTAEKQTCRSEEQWVASNSAVARDGADSRMVWGWPFPLPLGSGSEGRLGALSQARYVLEQVLEQQQQSRGETRPDPAVGNGTGRGEDGTWSSSDVAPPSLARVAVLYLLRDSNGNGDDPLLHGWLELSTRLELRLLLLVCAGNDQCPDHASRHFRLAQTAALTRVEMCSSVDSAVERAVAAGDIDAAAVILGRSGYDGNTGNTGKHDGDLGGWKAQSTCARDAGDSAGKRCLRWASERLPSLTTTFGGEGGVGDGDSSAHGVALGTTYERLSNVAMQSMVNSFHMKLHAADVGLMPPSSVRAMEQMALWMRLAGKTTAARAPVPGGLFPDFAKHLAPTSTDRLAQLRRWEENEAAAEGRRARGSDPLPPSASKDSPPSPCRLCTAATANGARRRHTSKANPDAELVFSAYLCSTGSGSHDHAFAVTRGGVVLASLELERLFNVRYFGFGDPPKGSSSDRRDFEVHGEEQLRRGYAALLDMLGSVVPAAPLFDVGLYPIGLEAKGIEVLQRVVSAKRWLSFNHHEAHAASGFYASPFRNALVITTDNGGNDGRHNVYLADRENGIEVLERRRSDFGFVYHVLGLALSELVKPGCQRGQLHLPGKKVGTFLSRCC